MRKFMKNNKKKGFTLIEMVAVVAIIGILAAILVPKITGYMKEAKKTGVIDQARKVTQAFETSVMKGHLNKDDAKTIAVESITDATMLSLLDSTTKDDAKKLLDKLPAGTTVEICQKIVEKTEFTVTPEGELELKSVSN